MERRGHVGSRAFRFADLGGDELPFVAGGAADHLVQGLGIFHHRVDEPLARTAQTVDERQRGGADVALLPRGRGGGVEPFAERLRDGRRRGADTARRVREDRRIGGDEQHRHPAVNQPALG